MTNLNVLLLSAKNDNNNNNVNDKNEVKRFYLEAKNQWMGGHVKPTKA